MVLDIVKVAPSLYQVRIVDSDDDSCVKPLLCVEKKIRYLGSNSALKINIMLRLFF